MCGRHPGRVERADGVSWRGSPALAGALLLPSPPGRGEEAGRMAGRTSGKSERKISEQREGQRDASERRPDGRQREALFPLPWLVAG